MKYINDNSSLHEIQKKGNFYLFLLVIGSYIFSLIISLFADMGLKGKTVTSTLMLLDMGITIFIYCSKIIPTSKKKYLYSTFAYLSLPVTTYFQHGSIDNTYVSFTILVSAMICADYIYLLFTTSIAVILNLAMYLISPVTFFPALSSDQFTSFVGLLFINGIILSLGVKLIVNYEEQNKKLKMLHDKLEENMKELKLTQDKLIHSDKLAGLGQLIGGISHNLKTPIMVISGITVKLEDLINEYKDSIFDETVTKDDHSEIADEMIEWIQKVKPQCKYMNDIISAVRGQTLSLNNPKENDFKLNDLVKDIEILLLNVARNKGCQLLINNYIESDLVISGDMNVLIQVLNNLITNSVEAYKGLEGVINLDIKKVEKDIMITVKDSAGGISKSIQEKLFKEMVTTKGTEGTGLGLYMSFSTIKRFGGDLWFESQEGKGTCFNIILPLSGQVVMNN
ncbi:sensor histidine kinase [Pseudobacteroides cellulosolvens]|uniref:histidine kinase n=1 Tax=Pseudobacteroides cellulosolvens ATCC 35603 = DSM 2933 TaxID=398512 RepID=A0A0L6JPZ9_9FIRM|nr:HAMP domain-containing sensor histidine kinase [Pseudobacteroides cellulosolvens]KNY27858.1 ATP-binding region ATPase domain protein [Pseudobacteroides cellulosolvens ATCC 35603 = DSM 2933]